MAATTALSLTVIALFSHLPTFAAEWLWIAVTFEFLQTEQRSADSNWLGMLNCVDRILSSNGGGGRDWLWADPT